MTILFFALVYQRFDVINDRSFVSCLYFSVITFTTVGYGDLRPVTPEGKVLAGALVFFGLGLLGFISAQLTARWLRTERREASVATELASLRSEIAEMKDLLLEATRSSDWKLEGGQDRTE